MGATLCAPAAVTVTAYEPARVPAELEARLMELTLDDGQLAPVYRSCKNPQAKSWVGKVFVATDADGTVAGWALRWKLRNNMSWSVFLFVDPDYRRRGVATELVFSAARRLGGGTRLCGAVWDDTSAAFWASIPVEWTNVADQQRR